MDYAGASSKKSKGDYDPDFSKGLATRFRHRSGRKANNQKLSVARADAVIAFLESQGVERVRMTGKGYADGMPVASNDTEEGRAQNRRVQVQIAANEKLKQQDAASANQQTQSGPR